LDEIPVFITNKTYNTNNAKLTPIQVRQIRAAAKDKLEYLAAKFGVHYTTISDIRLGKTWKSIT
jgi:hypothetical protein